MILTQNMHIVPVLWPIADAFAGTVNSDIVSLKNASHITFLVYWGVGATGTTTFTVEACDDVSASNTTAVAFNYKILLGAAEPVTEDTWGALTAATSSGILSVAGSFKGYALEVDAAVIAATGYEFVRVTAVEGVDSPILGGIFAMLHGLRHKGEVLPEAIS